MSMSRMSASAEEAHLAARADPLCLGDLVEDLPVQRARKVPHGPAERRVPFAVEEVEHFADGFLVSPVERGGVSRVGVREGLRRGRGTCQPSSHLRAVESDSRRRGSGRSPSDRCRCGRQGRARCGCCRRGGLWGVAVRVVATVGTHERRTSTNRVGRDGLARHDAAVDRVARPSVRDGRAFVRRKQVASSRVHTVSNDDDLQRSDYRQHRELRPAGAEKTVRTSPLITSPEASTTAGSSSESQYWTTSA